MAAGFYIRIATVDADGKLDMEPLRSKRGKKEVIASFDMAKLRRTVEAELNRRGFFGISCWASDKPGRRFDYTAEGVVDDAGIRPKLHAEDFVEPKRRAGSFVVAEIVL